MFGACWKGIHIQERQISKLSKMPEEKLLTVSVFQIKKKLLYNFCALKPWPGFGSRFIKKPGPVF
jgi:hypothetical protein